MSLIKRNIRNQIELIDNRDEKEQIESLSIDGKFLLTYNSITDNNPNPHNIKEFQ